MCCQAAGCPEWGYGLLRVTTVRPELEELLLMLVDAWEEGDREGVKGEFMFTQTMGQHGARLVYPGLAKGGAHNERVAVPDLEELADLGWIVITPTGPARGKFRITGEGVQQAHRARLQDVAVPGGLDWKQDVYPVLVALYTAMAKGGSPKGADQGSINSELGRDPGDATTDRVLYELERAGYIEASVRIQQSLGPSVARLTEKGLQHVAGWPGIERTDLADRLLWALEQRIEEADNDEERGKLRKLRDEAMGVGRDVLTDVLSKIATGQV
jgi:DNA-binding PadR family transcriptional regulator